MKSQTENIEYGIVAVIVGLFICSIGQHLQSETIFSTLLLMSGLGVITAGVIFIADGILFTAWQDKKDL